MMMYSPNFFKQDFSNNKNKYRFNEDTVSENPEFLCADTQKSKQTGNKKAVRKERESLADYFYNLITKITHEETV